jgi:hypothetical protein
LKIFSSAVSLGALIIATHGAVAADISASGAKDVAAAFESYLGKGKDGQSAVRVTTNAANDGYDVSIDIGRMVKPLEAAGVTFGPALYNFSVKPAANGTWAFAQTTFPKISVKAPGTAIEFALDGFDAKGVYDPALGAFLNQAITARSMTSQSEDPQGTVKAETQGIKFSGVSTAAGSGLIDSKIDYSATSLVETINLKETGGAPIKASVNDMTMKGDVSGQAAKAMLDLWSYAMAHPSKDALAADQDTFKAKLTAALPLFKRASMSGGAGSLVVETPMGIARIGKIGFTEALNGIVSDGSFEMGMSLGTIEPPAAIMPPWSAGLVPKDTAFSFKLTGYDADKFVRKAIAELDLKAEKPLDMEDDEAVAAILPSGKLNVTMAPGHIISDTYEVSWEGTMEITPADALVTGHAKVTAKGLDKVAAKLSKVPEAMQVVTGIYAAKAMSKPVGGADVWEIDFDSLGAVTVNGQKISGQ